ncbi:MAG: flagellar filament capping protein FliD [Lachnospiraceae bacterium]|nr:flagellar filament capping protein FliD [Lachnospiraceae bacterium]
MGIRMSGINSGLDTDAIVQALVSAQSMKVKKVENKLTKSEWKQEIWKDINTKLYSLYTGPLTKFKSQGSYNAKKVASSDESICTATAAASAGNGTHTLKVTSLASAQIVTSAQIKTSSGGSVTGSTKLVDSMGMTAGGKINIKNGSKTVEFEVKESSTIDDFVSALKKAGLNASFDKGQQRLFISNSNTGKENAFSISDEQTAVADMKQAVIDSFNKAIEDSSDEDKVIYQEKLDKITSLSEEEFLSLYNVEKNFPDLTDDEKEKFRKIHEGTMSEDTLTTDDEKEKYSKYKAYADYESELTAIYDELESIDSNFNSNVDAYVASIQRNNEIPKGTLLSKLGLQNFDENTADGTYEGMSFVKAEDAEIVLDGATLTGKSNAFAVNGLTLNLKNKTEAGKTITLTTTTDTDQVYNMVKDFIKSYNEILETMNTKYSAKPAKGYEPLTSEEKDAMSEDEVKKWEDKIKDSLLRRDGTLNSLISTMRQSLLTTTKVDGKSYSLSSFGIVTSSDYTEGGKLHLKGDPDDDTYGAEKDKLKAALEENPEAVMKTLSEAGAKLYEALKEKMARSSLSSALTFYNDKQMSSEQSSYKKQISEMQNKLTKLEDRYYKRFTKMEKAMAKMNSQTNSLMSLTGGQQ